jgi:hypothetical protein
MGIEGCRRQVQSKGHLTVDLVKGRNLYSADETSLAMLTGPAWSKCMHASAFAWRDFSTGRPWADAVSLNATECS